MKYIFVVVLSYRRVFDFSRSGNVLIDTLRFMEDIN